jgi:hypothetical protein
VVERYTREGHTDLQASITFNDQKAITKPFVITTSNLKWIPKQDFREQICVPSEEEDYLRIIVDLAAGRTPGNQAKRPRVSLGPVSPPAEFTSVSDA